MPENPSHQSPVTPGKEPIIYMVGSFYFAFIWFRVQGSGFRVQGSGFRVQGSGGGFAAFLEEGIPNTQPSPRGEGGEQSEPDRVLAV